MANDPALEKLAQLLIQNQRRIVQPNVMTAATPPQLPPFQQPGQGPGSDTLPAISDYIAKLTGPQKPQVPPQVPPQQSPDPLAMSSPVPSMQPMPPSIPIGAAPGMQQQSLMDAIRQLLQADPNAQLGGRMAQGERLS